METKQLAALLQIEHNVRACETLVELLFVIANETRNLVPYDQGVLLQDSGGNRLKVRVTADHASVDRSTPFVTFVEKMANRENQKASAATVHPVDTGNWTAYEQSEAAAFSPDHVLWMPLALPAIPTLRMGVFWLTRPTPWNETELFLLTHLAGTYAHAIHAFERQSVKTAFRQWLFARKVSRLLIPLGVLVACIPVRLSAIAPAEIAARDPVIVSAPLNGAIESIDVVPGQRVQAGDILFHLDNTELLNAFNVAEQALLEMKAELHTAQQSGFVNVADKAKIAELSTQVALKDIDRHFARIRLDKAIMHAAQDGLVIFQDPRDWEGKPVVVGERVMQIADPAKIELNVMLPVKDAIEFQSGADIRLFLDTDPLHAIPAHVRYVSYEPERTPDNVMAYHLVAEFAPGTAVSGLRIGMRGSAKLYGSHVSLFYYVFRRPITAARQWLGW